MDDTRCGVRTTTSPLFLLIFPFYFRGGGFSKVRRPLYFVELLNPSFQSYSVVRFTILTFFESLVGLFLSDRLHSSECLRDTLHPFSNGPSVTWTPPNEKRNSGHRIVPTQHHPLLTGEMTLDPRPHHSLWVIVSLFLVRLLTLGPCCSWRKKTFSYLKVHYYTQAG